ncbi:MAG: molecular chaperone DnaK, partial [Methylococcaceae bacterium]|nr:molecular chaperone DnaK [Methylococcaceae bacterium]
GYPLDDWRVEQIWGFYAEGLQFVNDKQNWAEWWTLWRRVAGGLDADAQQRILADIAKYIEPAAARQAGVVKQLQTRSYEDIVRLAAVLEQLSPHHKTQLGEWLLKRLQKSGEPEQTAWALGRVGARILFHGQPQNVIAASQVSVWLEQLLVMDWKKQPQLAFAATMLARRCNDRVRDVEEDLRSKVLDKLKQSKSPASWVMMVAEFQVLDAQQERQMFGEALPPGLKLVD